MSLRIALLGDTSTHGGAITDANQIDDAFKVENILVAVNGATLTCPTHGAQAITAITVKSSHNGRLIVTQNATAACGAVITPSDRGVYVE